MHHRSSIQRHCCRCSHVIEMSSLAVPSHDHFQDFGLLDGALYVDQQITIPPLDSCVSAVKMSCGNKTRTKHLHAYLALFGLENFSPLSEPLVLGLAKCTSFEELFQYFVRAPKRSPDLWTAILSSCNDQGLCQKTIELYNDMKNDGVEPNKYTFITLLKACNSLRKLELVKDLYADAKNHGFVSDPFIASTFVNLYGKLGHTMEAENAFVGSQEQDIVSWNSMLLAYVEQGEGEKPLQLFRQLLEEGMEPSERTLSIVLQACCLIEVKPSMERTESVPMPLEIGQCLHAYAWKKGFYPNLFLGSNLITLYSRFGSVLEAEDVFLGMSRPDGVVWNAMLFAYVREGQAERCVQLYVQMLDGGVHPSQRTFTILLQACCMLLQREEAAVMKGYLSSRALPLKIGRTLHEDARKYGLDTNLFIRTRLVAMYGLAGSLVEAEEVFFGLPEVDTVLLNAMLCAYVESGHAEVALAMYREHQAAPTLIDEHTMVITLQAVSILAEDGAATKGQQSKAATLNSGRILHADALKRGFDLDPFVCCTLVKMYGKCGSIFEAEEVFRSLGQYDIVLWSGMLSAYVSQGKEEESLLLYRQMKEEGIEPDGPAFVTALQACLGLIAMESDRRLIDIGLDIGQGLYGDLSKAGLGLNPYVGSSLMNVFGKCGLLEEVDYVFVGLGHRDMVSWNALLSAYVEQAQAVKALQLFRQMLVEGIDANEQTFLVSLKACGMLALAEAEGSADRCLALSLGEALYDDLCCRDFVSSVPITSTMLCLFGQCQRIDKAENLFKGMVHRDVVSWTAMISAFVDQGQGKKALYLYRQMYEEGVGPDEQVFLTAFQACCALFEERQADLEEGHATDIIPLRIGQALHVDAQRQGFDSSMYIKSSLLCMYGKCGSIVDLESMSHCLLWGSCVPWNAMISGFVEHDDAKKALQLYVRMQEEGVHPDAGTYVLALQACCMLGDDAKGCAMGQDYRLTCLEIGKALYTDASRNGFSSDKFITSMLLIMYGKCGSIVEAGEVFQGLLQCDTSLWNAMLSAYLEQDQSVEALKLFERMKQDGPSPNKRTFVIATQACQRLAEEEANSSWKGHVIGHKCLNTIGQELHAGAYKMGFEVDAFVGNAFVSMYGKLVDISAAEYVFGMLPQHDIVSWNALLSVYAQNGQAEKAICKYRQMRQEGSIMNSITFLSILHACKESGRVDVCKELHFEIVSSITDLSAPLATSLIDAYGSCGCTAEAQQTLDSLFRSGVVEWSALLAGYAQGGNLSASLSMYNQMQLRDVQPDGVTSISLLSMFNHTGLVQEGIDYYGSLCKHDDIEPNTNHLISLLDLMLRAGNLAKAKGLLSSAGAVMGSNLVMWLCLIRACGRHGHMELGKIAFQHAICVQPKHGVSYVLMSNMYADIELWSSDE